MDIRYAKNVLFLGFFVSTILPAAAGLLQGCFQPSIGISFSKKWEGESGYLNSTSDRGGTFLENSTLRSIERYGPIIQQYAYEYELDWRLILAVMRQESSFRPSVTSHKGAFGLMQLMPTTQGDLIEKLGVPEAESPKYNIQAGMYHLRSLHRFFRDAKGEERTKLALASYNAGLGRILDAQDIAAYIGKDPNSWTSVRSVLPLMAGKYESFHVKVWKEGRPRSGPFNNSQETIAYVENVLRYYESYRQALQ